MYILKNFTFQHLLFLIFSKQNTNPSPRTGPQDLLVTHYDCEENEQKTQHKYAINQVTQCESEPQAIETTKKLPYSRKPEQGHLQAMNLQQHFPERKYIVYKFPMEIKTDLITNLSIKAISKEFYTSNPTIVKMNYSD